MCRYFRYYHRDATNVCPSPLCLSAVCWAPCDQVAATHSRVVVGHKVSINEIDDVDVLHSTNGGDPP